MRIPEQMCRQGDVFVISGVSVTLRFKKCLPNAFLVLDEHWLLRQYPWALSSR